VYANNLETAVSQAIKLYEATKQTEQEKTPVAPMELKWNNPFFELRVGFSGFLATVGIGTLLLYFKWNGRLNQVYLWS